MLSEITTKNYPLKLHKTRHAAWDHVFQKLTRLITRRNSKSPILAKYERIPTNFHTLIAVIAVTRKFDDYLTQLKDKLTDEDLADEFQIR